MRSACSPPPRSPLILLAGCGGGERSRAASGTLQVGLVFDVGGIGDKSFNDAAYRGLLKARDELKVGIEYFEPAEGTDREAALRLLAAGAPDLIFGIGFLFTDDIKAVAQEFPKKQFACVDYSRRRRQDSGESGGAQVPRGGGLLPRRRDRRARHADRNRRLRRRHGHPADPQVRSRVPRRRARRESGRRILSNYAGVTGDAFKNPAKGKELALAQIDAGADIIFHASGSTGLGVFEAARERDKLAIGVDSDQQAEAPGHFLTSMVKRVDVAVFDTIQSTQQGKWAGGVREMGLAEGALDYVYDDNNKVWITDDVRAKVEALRADILAGRLTVPTR